jgi:hypothetical protein
MMADVDRQLELTLGPQYVVEVEDRLTASLARRQGSSYASPPQSEASARRLAALLLDFQDEPAGDGPWRRPLAGGHREVRLVRAATS